MMMRGGRWALTGGLALVGACVLQTETVTGPKPEPGVDPALVAQLQDKISQLEGKLGDLQGQIDELKAEPVCPRGYDHDPGVEGFVVCKRGVDEVVKVGSGGSAFWVDRYEASVWTKADGALTGGAQKFDAGDDSTNSFPKNGQALSPLFALSVAGVTPAAGLTWFQATEACAASGKRLPNGSEWLRAARGTHDPEVGVDGLVANEHRCHTKTTNDTLRLTGNGVDPSGNQVSCVSDWGAEDMIGNVWELTDDWFAGLADQPGGGVNGGWPDPQNEFRHDFVSNVSSYAQVAGGDWVAGAPTAALRGGDLGNGTGAGTFSLSLAISPTSSFGSVGFRCVIPR
jgi:formylglycine-generating enzyme required for sulfatase activity